MTRPATRTVVTTNTSFGFGSLLTILFVGLKLTGQIDWSWWWVLSPLWIPFVIVILILSVLALLLWKGKI